MYFILTQKYKSLTLIYTPFKYPKVEQSLPKLVLEQVSQKDSEFMDNF